jgi:hypothetical protein
MMARRAGILGPKTLTKRHSTRWGGMAEAELGTDRQQPRWLADGDPRQGRRVAANDGHDTLALQVAGSLPACCARRETTLPCCAGHGGAISQANQIFCSPVTDRAHGRIKSNSSSPPAARDVGQEVLPYDAKHRACGDGGGQQQHGYQIGIISHERHERTLGAELSRCIPIAR